MKIDELTLKEDITIPAGTTFSPAPMHSERVDAFEALVAMNADNTAFFTIWPEDGIEDKFDITGAHSAEVAK